MLDPRVLGVGLDPLERRLGARSLDLELRHEDRRLAGDALRVDDRPLVREEPEAGEVLDVVGAEEDVAGAARRGGRARAAARAAPRARPTRCGGRHRCVAPPWVERAYRRERSRRSHRGCRAATTNVGFAPVLPAGVRLVPLTPHVDERGVFTELFRASWDVGVAPIQWNAASSHANVLRRVHAHVRHADYLTLAVGRATIGLHDLRPDHRRRDSGRRLSSTPKRRQHS